MHWKILVKLIATLPENIHGDFINYQSPFIAIPSILQESIPEYIDTHFHLDTLLKRTHFQTFADLEAGIDHQGVHLSHLIGNYVFPSSWSLRARQVRGSPHVHCTVGVHPHQVGPSRVGHAHLAQIEDMLSRDDFVAVGEVGLDFTSSCRHRNCPNRRLCQDGRSRLSARSCGVCCPWLSGLTRCS